MVVKVINNSKHELPRYADEGSAGLDLRANIDAPVYIPVGGRALIKTGLSVELPKGTELQIRGRSGLALKNGVSLANGIGTIDSKI